MRIAVIGANGFIGSRLVEQLHLGGEHTVVPVVRSPAGLARASRFDVPWKIADALDADALRAALQGCEAVVHAAAHRGREIERMPATLCSVAAAAGIHRIVWLSCASVHGPIPEPGTNEHSALRTDHPLPDTNHRVVAEGSFLQQCSRRGLAGIALRPGIAYGPRSPWFAGLAQELRSGCAWWFGDGRGIFNGIYVDNLVAAIFSALAAPTSAAGKPYLVGDEETVTWREFYLATAGLLGASSRRIASIAELPPEPEKTRARLRRLVESPGMKAVAPALPTGVKRFAKLLLANPPAPLDGWAPLTPAGPVVTLELALQQQCRWRLPHKRAARALGFRPRVAFSQGLKRTTDWLAFAEGDRAKNSVTETPERGASPTILI